MNSELAVIQAETELAKAKVIAEAFEGLLDDDVGGEFENLAPSLSAHDKVSCYVENLVQPAQQVCNELGLQNNDKSPKVEANDVMTTGSLSSTNQVSMINVTLSDIAHATDLTNSASLQTKLVSSTAPENYLFSSHNIQCHSQNSLRDVLSNTVIDTNLRTHIPSTMLCQCTTVTGGVTSTLSAYAAPCYATPSHLPISSILTSSGPCNLEPTSLYAAVPGSLTQTLPVNHDNVGPARLNTIQNSFTRPCQSVTFAASNISQPSATFANPPPGFSLQKPLSTHVRVMAPQYSTASLNPMPLPVNDQQSDTKRSSDMKEFAQILVRCQGSRPLAEEQRFDGDPLKYHIFIRQVQDRILRIHGESDPAHALQLLLDSTTGPARKLISNCIMLPDDQALQEALNLLYKAFGSPSVSIKAHLKLVCEGPQIRTDEKSLRDFHADLINCKMILETANAGHQLNATSTAEGIFTRFPRHYQEQFAKLAMTKGYDMDIVPFNLFIEFIDQVLSLASSSLGRLMATTKDNNRTQQRSCLRPGSKPTPKGRIKLNQQANQQIPRLATSEKVQARPVVAAQHTHTDSEKLCPLHTGSRHSLTD